MPYVPWDNCRVFLITGTSWKLVGDEFRSMDNYVITDKLKSTWLMFNNPRPGQYFTHAHSNITREVRAMDSYFTLIRAHQHDTAVGPALYGQSRVQTPTLYQLFGPIQVINIEDVFLDLNKKAQGNFGNFSPSSLASLFQIPPPPSQGVFPKNRNYN